MLPGLIYDKTNQTKIRVSAAQVDNRLQNKLNQLSPSVQIPEFPAERRRYRPMDDGISLA